ncbi:hypothetical protein BC835DRAFT_87876 [Cytidiella melzeri]|nr:hypothetical protein BC835DRAFT_87876 [Cytidiella melzeri]
MHCSSSLVFFTAIVTGAFHMMIAASAIPHGSEGSAHPSTSADEHSVFSPPVLTTRGSKLDYEPQLHGRSNAADRKSDKKRQPQARITTSHWDDFTVPPGGFTIADVPGATENNFEQMVADALAARRAGAYLSPNALTVEHIAWAKAGAIIDNEGRSQLHPVSPATHLTSTPVPNSPPPAYGQ